MLGHMASKELAPRTQPSAAELREEERKKRTNIDRILLTNARLAPQELAERTGLTVEAAMTRLYELLRARDHLSERQEERLLIIEMGDLIDEVKDRMSGANDENFADIANVALRGYEAISKRLDARRKITEADIGEITKAQGEMFLAVMIEAVNMVATRLEEYHPDLDFDIRGEIEEGFAIAIPEARAAVSKRVRE